MQNDKLITPKLPPPTWISPEGLPWYKDNRATEYAQSLLPSLEVWLMRDATNEYQYVLLDHSSMTPDGKPIIRFAGRDIDQIGKEVDRIAFMRLNSIKGKH